MPKIVDHSRYRQELLGQCLELFAEKGFRAVTMRQIAQSLGVSTGTLYHYFPNKESIFVQLVEEYCEKDITAFFAHASFEMPLEAKVRAVMAFFMQNYVAYQRQLLIWVDFYQHDLHSDRLEQSVLQQFWHRAHSHLATYLQLPAEQIDCFLCFLDGLLLQCLYHREEKLIAQQVEAFIAIFVTGCRENHDLPAPP